MKLQPKALHLAECIDYIAGDSEHWQVLESAAEELRRLYKLNEELLKEINEN